MSAFCNLLASGFKILEYVKFSFVLCNDESNDMFFQLFLAKRMEQLQAVKNILSLGN